MIKKELYDELCEVFGIEKGIRTVTVPPANGRKGYQYQRNFPENKKENEFRGKKSVSLQNSTVGKLKSLLAAVKKDIDNAESSIIKLKSSQCLNKKEMHSGKCFYYHSSRNPLRNNSQHEKEKSKIEFMDAELLAEKGLDVFLPSESDGLGTYDAIINGVPFDFKNISGNLETVKKQSQKGFKQARGVVLFFKNKTSTDYMKYAAMMNGATNTSLKKTVSIIYFIKEKEIQFFDMREVFKKSGDYAESAISKDCRSITPTSKNIPQTSETVKDYVEKSIQILKECGAV